MPHECLHSERDAILRPARDASWAYGNMAHMGRWLTARDMIRAVAQPDMRVIDIASMGAILPALREALGFSDVTVTGPPAIGRPANDELPPTSDGTVFTCPYERFDIEEPFPYADATFDLVILTGVLEHLTRDPMHTLSVNRITKNEVWLMLSTPNCCSLRAVVNALLGRHPYMWSQYSSDGHRDWHNREYTPSEVRDYLATAGLG
jgi:SAM-dependent methyltransferase